MTFAKLTDTSFSITEKVEGKTEITTYGLPEHFSLWQSQRIGKTIARAFKETGNLGQVIISAGFSFLSTQKENDQLTALMKDLQAITGGGLDSVVSGAISGAGELLDFLTKDDMLAQIAAVLFLNLDAEEMRLTEEQLKTRTDLFLSIPLTIVFGGLFSFFEKRPLSKINSASPSQTSETQTIPTPQPNESSLIPSNVS